MQGNRSRSSTQVQKQTAERAKSRADRKKAETLSQKLSDALGYLDKMEKDLKEVRRMQEALIEMTEEGESTIDIDQLLEVFSGCYFLHGDRIEQQVEARKEKGVEDGG